MDEADRCNILGLMNAGNLIVMDHPEALKKGLPVDFYELSSTSTLESFDKLLSLDHLSQVSLYGEKIHISSEMEAQSLQKSIMEDNSLRINSITKIDPMLEDVFIYHVLESERR